MAKQTLVLEHLYEGKSRELTNCTLSLGKKMKNIKTKYLKKYKIQSRKNKEDVYPLCGDTRTCEKSERSYFGANSIDIRLVQPVNQFYLSIINREIVCVNLVISWPVKTKNCRFV